MGQVFWGMPWAIQVDGYDARREDIKEREPPRKGGWKFFSKKQKNKELNSVLPSVKLVPIIYKKLNLRLAWGEHYSQLLLEFHFSVTLVSSAIHLNLA